MPDASGVERAAALLRSAATRLRADHEHGASWLAREAAAALDEAAALVLAGPPASESARESDVRALRQAARELAHARPSMAAIATTVARICAAGWSPGAAALERTRAEANRLADAWNEAAAAIGAHAQDLLTGTVLTHSRSGTVEQVLARLASAGRVNALIVTTSLPGGEGSALAHALAQRGIDVTLVADAAMGWALTGVDAVVLGADSVRADASLVNKVGSLPLALCAQRADVPVYVLCESLKIAPSGWSLTLEEMDPAELLPASEPHLRARNPYFDHTPADLITAIITEMGPTSREHIAQLAESAARELAALEQA
jgi:translation initiation factor 2B subunit (eIF-2B alpha/beta/delta family)